MVDGKSDFIDCFSDDDMLGTWPVASSAMGNLQPTGPSSCLRPRNSRTIQHSARSTNAHSGAFLVSIFVSTGMEKSALCTPACAANRPDWQIGRRNGIVTQAHRTSSGSCRVIVHILHSYPSPHAESTRSFIPDTRTISGGKGRIGAKLWFLCNV